MDNSKIFAIDKQHESLRESLDEITNHTYHQDELDDMDWSNFYWDLDIRQNYLISDHGVVWDMAKDREVESSANQYGDIRVNLWTAGSLDRKTVSVRNAVATAFVYQPSSYYTSALIKDMDQENLHYTNLVWRPLGYSRRYRAQFEQDIWLLEQGPVHVAGKHLGYEYKTIADAARSYGVLGAQIFDSCDNDGIECVIHLDFGFQWA